MNRAEPEIQEKNIWSHLGVLKKVLFKKQINRNSYGEGGETLRKGNWPVPPSATYFLAGYIQPSGRLVGNVVIVPKKEGETSVSRV